MCCRRLLFSSFLAQLVNLKKFCNTLDNGSNVQELGGTDGKTPSPPEEKPLEVISDFSPGHGAQLFAQVALYFFLNCQRIFSDFLVNLLG